MSQSQPNQNQQAQDGRNIRMRKKVAVRVDPQVILQSYIAYADIHVQAQGFVGNMNKVLEKVKPLTKVYTEGESKTVLPVNVRKAFYQYLGTASQIMYRMASENVNKILAEIEEARRQNDVAKVAQLYKQLVAEVQEDILAMRIFSNMLAGFLNTKLPMSLRSELDNAMLLGIHFVEGE